VKSGVDNVTSKVDRLLQVCGYVVQGVKELMDEMKVKDTVIQVRNQNYQRLQDELDKLVVSHHMLMTGH
jgi:hypothetical protein